MKKLIYISGIVLVNLFVIGTICKLLHFPGANIFILTGLVLFTVALLPMALINNYRSNGKEKGSLYIAAYLTSALILVSAMFKIFHWPGAGYLMMIATPLPFALFLPVFLYHNRKHEPKQSLNFIGVMLLLVYVAVFSSLLALNVSKNVINGISITANDFSSVTKIYEQNSSEKYKALKSSENPDVAGLQQKSEIICRQIEEVKAELVRAIDGEDSPAIDAAGNVDISKVINKTESNTSTAIMNGKYETYGEATVLKKSVAEYCAYLLALAENDNLKQLITSLLNTSEGPSEVNPGETDTWEMRYFPRSAYLITILGNLCSLESNVRIAESCILEQY
ncbi:hypothetical protein SDC9_81122 [bioreactor metagenome]|uniref:Gliding motility-associated protein GldM N-terminal domain-containing protein n=1 Tax=bioreactor metagenome TaxID=1076179 RepID=A0A644Z126_9ZZZZ